MKFLTKIALTIALLTTLSASASFYASDSPRRSALAERTGRLEPPGEAARGIPQGRAREGRARAQASQPGRRSDEVSVSTPSPPRLASLALRVSHPGTRPAC